MRWLVLLLMAVSVMAADTNDVHRIPVTEQAATLWEMHGGNTNQLVCSILPWTDDNLDGEHVLTTDDTVWWMKSTPPYSRWSTHKTNAIAKTALCTLPTLNLKADRFVTTEGGPPIRIRAWTTGRTKRKMSVKRTISGTATPVTDYTVDKAKFELDSGKKAMVVTITPVDDDDAEDAETIIIQIHSPSNVVLGPKTIATFTIEDND